MDRHHTARAPPGVDIDAPPEPPRGRVRAAPDLRAELRRSGDTEAMERLLAAGNVPGTRRADARMLEAYHREHRPGEQPVATALRMVLAELRTLHRNATVLSFARRLESVLYKEMVATLRGNPRWQRMWRALRRSLSGTTLPKVTPRWAALRRKLRELRRPGGSRELAALLAVMMLTGARFLTVYRARLGDLLRHGRRMALCLWGDKMRSLTHVRRYAVPTGPVTEILAPYAMLPREAEALVHTEWSARPPLIPLPSRWPGEVMGFPATGVRRAVINQLQRRFSPAEAAGYIGHSRRTQETSYWVGVPHSMLPAARALMSGE